MKSIFKVILIAAAFCSCNANANTETTENDISQAVVDESEAQSSRFAQITGDSDATNQKDSSLIGKTTVEIEKMGWFNCAGTLIGSDESGREFSVSQLARSQEECRNGTSKILFERFITRNRNKAIFEVIDEINIESNYPEKEYNWTNCKVKGANGEEFYVIHFKDQRQAELTEIYDLWSVDLIAGKFVKLENLNGLTCFNPDYSDGL